jgi:hypothetical protein
MLPPGDPRHGTVNGYDNYLCRCDACKHAHNVKHAEWRWRTGRNLPRDEWLARYHEARVPQHGTESEY